MMELYGEVSHYLPPPLQPVQVHQPVPQQQVLVQPLHNYVSTIITTKRHSYQQNKRDY
jgi:hypothetical protein